MTLARAGFLVGLVITGILIAYGMARPSTADPGLANVDALANVSTLCTIGLTGTDLEIQVEGIGALDTCVGSESLGRDDGRRWFVFEQRDPVGDVVCHGWIRPTGDPEVVDERSVEWTVFDQGVLQIYGLQTCADLERRGLAER